MLPIISLLLPPFSIVLIGGRPLLLSQLLQSIPRRRTEDMTATSKNKMQFIPPFLFSPMFTAEIYISPEQGVAGDAAPTHKKENPDSACSPPLPSIKFSLFCPLPMMLGAKTNTGVGERLFCPIMRDETILPFFSFGETGETSLLGQDQQ